jgi:hypothetical protein
VSDVGSFVATSFRAESSIHDKAVGYVRPDSLQ